MAKRAKQNKHDNRGKPKPGKKPEKAAAPSESSATSAPAKEQAAES